MNYASINVCPYCHGLMEKKPAPFYYHNHYIGKFEAYVCSECHRKFFTEEAYNEIMKIPIFPKDFSNFIENSLINRTFGVSIQPSMIPLDKEAFMVRISSLSPSETDSELINSGNNGLISSSTKYINTSE